MSVPDPWVFVVLVLAAARVVHFILWDSMAGLSLDSGTKLAQRIDVWAFDAEGADRGPIRGKLGTGLVCPYCWGGWVSLAVVCAYGWVPPWRLDATGAIVWLAVWAGQCVASKLDHRYIVD